MQQVYFPAAFEQTVAIQLYISCQFWKLWNIMWLERPVPTKYITKTKLLCKLMSSFSNLSFRLLLLTYS